MGKRRRDDPPAGDDAPAFHTPFAGLGGLAAGLPPGPAPGDDADAEPSGDGARDARGWPDKVVLRHEKKGRGGKTVTRIAGVPAERREDTARSLRRALGCGATVEGADVVLLGRVADRAAAWLRDAGAARIVVGN